jgi:microsomal dipeptidase-like Zn-dependent dipeptidase
MDVSTYKHYLVDENKFTPDVFESLKKHYATAKQRMYKNANYMVSQAQGTEKDTKVWIAWMVECCETFGRYYSIIEMLKEHGLIDYTEDEITTCWGLYAPEQEKRPTE